MKENDVDFHGVRGGMRARARLAGVAAAALCLVAAWAPQARAEEVSVADCERDSAIDVWAAADVEFCRKVMGEVFALAGMEPTRAEFDGDGMLVVSNAEVVCSAFRTPKLLEDYDFPRQPLGRMHYALYATPDRADLMLSMRITDWPRMKVAYSPVSQGMNPDRESYFAHANLEPEYVEYRTSEGAVEALKAGEVDALFLYTPYGKRPEGLVEIVPIGMRNVYFAVRKDRPELMERLAAAYREWYIDNIERYDGWREELLGIRRPAKRVRIAAYSRGDLFKVAPDGTRSGLIEDWIRSLCAITHWTPDYVYGDYDQSVGDVMAGRLDLVGGLGFSPARGKALEFPHTPIGMLRVYLWARPDSPYQAGRPETWKGMKIGLLAGSLSAQRVKQRQEEKHHEVELREFLSNRELLAAYFSGEVDGCVNIEMSELDRERALRLYASHPMYLVCAKGKPELFRDLEEALDVVCDDAPKYMRLISEKHYGSHSDMSELTIQESEWLERRAEDPKPIVIDFSPWPFPVHDEKGRPMGLPKALLEELARHTGLKFEASPQTGIHTAEAKFLRGDTDFWIPYPERPDMAAYGALDVFSLPVPQSCSELYGASDFRAEFMMFTHASTPTELTSILRKTMESIPSQQWTEMFMAAAAGRMAERTFFGLTDAQLKEWALGAAGVFAILVMIYAISFIVLLKRQARLAQEAAHQANEASMAKSRFLAMMSHELRTPLNAVIGFAEFLCQENALESKRREWVHGILASATALLDLINDILDLSKLEIGSMNMRAGKCRVAEVIGELPAIFGHRVKEKGVDFTVHKTSEGNIPALRLSRQGMRQVLINLVGNSAKFTQGGRIAVEYGWEAATSTLRVIVRDTGCGITAEKMARLFDPFVQDISSRMYERAGNATNKGTGLGLPIVKRLVDSAGGTITVDSRLGEGTRFTIEIPGLETVAEEGSGGTAIGAGVHTAEAAPAAAAAAPAKPAKPSRIPKTVLVVDDIAMNRKVLGIHLGKLGVGEIRYAENGAKALEALADWTPDIVLSDIWMPEMDGQQLSEAMHADARLSAIPIVAITADVEVDTTHDTKHFAKVLAKPVTGAKIAALFEELAL
jgi:signal transduction histidine kinase/ABC-type amino acid transport substrate-binding protein